MGGFPLALMDIRDGLAGSGSKKPRLIDQRGWGLRRPGSGAGYGEGISLPEAAGWARIRVEQKNGIRVMRAMAGTEAGNGNMRK